MTSFPVWPQFDVRVYRAYGVASLMGFTQFKGRRLTAMAAGGVGSSRQSDAVVVDQLYPFLRGKLDAKIQELRGLPKDAAAQRDVLQARVDQLARLLVEAGMPIPELDVNA